MQPRHDLICGSHAGPVTEPAAGNGGLRACGFSLSLVLVGSLLEGLRWGRYSVYQDARGLENPPEVPLWAADRDGGGGDPSAEALRDGRRYYCAGRAYTVVIQPLVSSKQFKMVFMYTI